MAYSGSQTGSRAMDLVMGSSVDELRDDGAEPVGCVRETVWVENGNIGPCVHLVLGEVGPLVDLDGERLDTLVPACVSHDPPATEAVVHGNTEAARREGGGCRLDDAGRSRGAVDITVIL